MKPKNFPARKLARQIAAKNRQQVRENCGVKNVGDAHQLGLTAGLYLSSKACGQASEIRTKKNRQS